jgi:hypothetical protein
VGGVTERDRFDDIDWSLTTWEGNRRAQMELWARMSLDEILEAQEAMAALTEDFARQAREERSAAGARHEGVPGA